MKFIRIALLSAVAGMASLSPMAQEENHGFQSRAEVPKAFKWDLSLFYDNWQKWESDLEETIALYEQLAGYKGRLSEGPETLLEVFRLSDEAGKKAIRVYGFAFQSGDLDTRDNAVRAHIGKLREAFTRVGTMLSWMDPEILNIPQETMMGWIKDNPAFDPYRFRILDTYRNGTYILDESGENLLSLHRPVRRAASDIYSSITNADGARPEITLKNGESLVVTPGIYRAALSTYRNAADRRAVQEAWMKQFEERRNTFASIYNGVLQQGWALAQARGFDSTLEMELYENAIPRQVVDLLLEVARSGSDQLQRYNTLRKQFMGADTYGWSDMHIPLVEDDSYHKFEDIVPEIIDSVGLLGPEYQDKMRDQLSAGYVDVFETPGKRSGAYNTSRYGVGSFVLLNYQGTLDNVFTVAHEMGHSLHSRLSQDYQPYALHRYTIFVAEVASTFNEKLLLESLLRNIDDRKERVALIESQIEKIVGTFFNQSMMADFEIRAHALLESGEGITANRLTKLWRETVKTYHGETIPDDDPYMLSWARIPHLYQTPFYVYQYATSLAASSAIMKSIKEDPGMIDCYLDLLKSGGNDFPMNQLTRAEVDLCDKAVLDAVIDEFKHLVDLLEKEYSLYLEEIRPIG